MTNEHRSKEKSRTLSTQMLHCVCSVAACASHRGDGVSRQTDQDAIHDLHEVVQGRTVRQASRMPTVNVCAHAMQQN